MEQQHPILFKNTLTGQKAPFVPLNPAKVGFYVCGITPYSDSHLGHARAYVVFDVVYRLLRHVYGSEAVTYVRNFTDIADEIIARAAENNEAPMDLANRVIAGFHADMQALSTLPPTLEPRVSDPAVLRGIVAHIQKLLELGYAYVAPNGDVNYRAAKFPTYGQLAGRKLDEQRAGARVAVDEGKESPHDFVLWKANANSATKMVQAFSPLELGATLPGFTALGRPGWHIECSVMSAQTLLAGGLGQGATTFDIHGGGEDLQFPHHSCEIAQTEALTGQPMAQVWLHNAFITVGGTKMSKSLGNFTTIKDVLAKHSPQAVRLWLLQTHYRKPVDYSEAAVTAAEKPARRLQAKLAANGPQAAADAANPHVQAALKALCDDLNTSMALAELNKLVGLDTPEAKAALPVVAALLGFA
jgi:cysteinyl-tRNA synthetase